METFAANIISSNCAGENGKLGDAMDKAHDSKTGDDLAKLVREAELKGIWLSELKAKFFRKDAKLPLDAEIKVEASHSAEGENSFLVKISLGFKGFDKSRRKVVEMRIVYDLEYECSVKDYSDDTLKKYAQTSSVIQVWPFLRKHIVELTADMGVPPFILPLMRAVPEE